MTYLRSGIFQVCFYLSFIVQMIIFTPIYFLLPLLITVVMYLVVEAKAKSLRIEKKPQN